MKVIHPKEISENLFTLLDDEWMLVTARAADGRVNTMTASWGGFGIMWGKAVCICVIRPQRYTLEFVNQAEELTLSFLKEGHRDALTLCGRKSGRDCDKIAEAGLNVVSDGPYPFFEESRLVICGKKLYVDQVKPDGFVDPSLSQKVYPNEDYHYVFVSEITKVLAE